MVGEAGDEDEFDWDWDGEDEDEFLADCPTPTPPLKGRGFEEAGLRPRKPHSRWTADTERAFLVALRLTGQVKKAAAEIGRCHQTAYKRRLADPAFAARWDEAIAAQQAEWVAAARERLGPGLDGGEEDAGGGRLTPWRDRAGGWDPRKRGLFLRTLARTKRVDDACAAAGISSSAAYYLRGQSPRFAAAWEKALAGAAPSVIEAAYARAVEGWEEPILAGGKIVGSRRRYSEGVLRDLLKAEQARARERGSGGGDAGAGAAGAEGVTALALEDVKAVVARLRKLPDPRGRYWKNAAQRYAAEVAAAAGGVFTLKALSDETDAAILDKIEKMDLVRGRERAGRDAAEWARWRGSWGAMGSCSGGETL